ncbi:unnamed protein product [Rhodiola kirilowii]
MSDPTWFFDSCVTNHVTDDFNNLAIQSDYNGNNDLQVGNGSDTTQRNH